MFGMVPFNFRNSPARNKDSWDRLLESVFDQPLNPLHKVSAAFSSFRVDVKDNGDSYEVTAELPGFSKEEISVTYQDKYLIITGEHAEESETKEGEKYICRERHSGRIERSFYIDDADENQGKAEFKDGILKIELKKLSAPVESQKTIQID